MLRVVSLPSEGFDGIAMVSFEADGMPPGEASSSSPALDIVSTGGGGDDDVTISVETSKQEGGGGEGSGAVSAIASFSTTSETAPEEEEGGGAEAAAPSSSVSFDVEFYHCDAGDFWTSIEGGSAAGGATTCGVDGSDSCCQLCSDFVQGSEEVRDKKWEVFLFVPPISNLSPHRLL